MGLGKLAVNTLCENYPIIHSINEFISRYDAFCSVLMDIYTLDSYIITGCFQIQEIYD